MSCCNRPNPKPYEEGDDKDAAALTAGVWAAAGAADEEGHGEAGEDESDETDGGDADVGGEDGRNDDDLK